MSDPKPAVYAEINNLLSQSFGAVIFTNNLGRTAANLHVISAQDHDTTDEAYSRLATCAIALGHIAETLTFEDFEMIARAVSQGGEVFTGTRLIDAAEEPEGPLDLSSFFRMLPKGNA